MVLLLSLLCLTSYRLVKDVQRWKLWKTGLYYIILMMCAPILLVVVGTLTFPALSMLVLLFITMKVPYIRLIFRSGFSYAYFASRWPFAKLNTCENSIQYVWERGPHTHPQNFVKPTFARFTKYKTYTVHERSVQIYTSTNLTVGFH